MGLNPHQSTSIKKERSLDRHPTLIFHALPKEKQNNMTNITHFKKNARSCVTVLGTHDLQKSLNAEHIVNQTGELKASEMYYSSKPSTCHTRSNDIISLREHKRDINAIASGFGSLDDDDYDQKTISYARETSGRMSKCLNFGFINKKTRKSTARIRCKSHACPYCTHIKQLTRCTEFSEGLKLLNPSELDYSHLSLITISYRVKSNDVTEVRKQQKSLSTGFSKLLSYRKFRKFVLGSVRAIENIESTHKKGFCHVHLHALVLTNSAKAFPKRDTLAKLTCIISKLMESPVKINLHIRTELKKKTEPEAVEQLQRAFNYLHKSFGLKTRDQFKKSKLFGEYSTSSIRKQSIEFYLVMTQAIYRQRLYGTTGVISEILKLGREQIRINKEKDDVSRVSDIATNHSSNENILVYWKRRMVTFPNGLRQDLGDYYIARSHLTDFCNDMKIFRLAIKPKPRPKPKIQPPSSVIKTPDSKIHINSLPDQLKTSGQQLGLFNLDDSKNSDLT